jgi:hypothetical protein
MIQRIVSKYTARAKPKSALQAARNLMSTGFRPACKMYSGRQQVFNYTVERRIERGFCQCLISSIKGEVKKKHLFLGWKFSCFSAYSIEQDLF